MHDNKRKFGRRSIRAKEYDYSRPGMYFVTICTQDRFCCLGDITRGNDPSLPGEMKFLEIGEIVEEIWLTIPEHHPVAELDECVIMPNHIHGIIEIGECDRRGIACNARPEDAIKVRTRIKSPSGSLSTIIASFKSAATNKIRQTKGHEDFAWQKNYYEHVIRNENSLKMIRRYINNNPAYWYDDVENPDNRIDDDGVAGHYGKLFY